MAGLAPERDRERSIGDHAPALNVGFMDHLLNKVILTRPEGGEHRSKMLDPTGKKSDTVRRQKFPSSGYIVGNIVTITKSGRLVGRQ